MTRKDYVKIASAINYTIRHYDSLGQDTMNLHFLIGYMGTDLAMDNPNFDYDRFVDACTATADK